MSYLCNYSLDIFEKILLGESVLNEDHIPHWSMNVKVG